ncbi:MAG: hypothetical protein F7C35_03505 [Desulfurococcales archaeon]|nr:hypothetical protein [Desulfurococcales archaeon]
MMVVLRRSVLAGIRGLLGEVLYSARVLGLRPVLREALRRVDGADYGLYGIPVKGSRYGRKPGDSRPRRGRIDW